MAVKPRKAIVIDQGTSSGRGTFNIRSYMGRFDPRKPIPVAARSKAWICGCSLAGIVGSNAARGMDLCLLWALCVVR